MAQVPVDDSLFQSDSPVTGDVQPPPNDPPSDPIAGDLTQIRYSLAISDPATGALQHLPHNELVYEQQDSEVATRITATIPDRISNIGPLWELCAMGKPAWLLAGVGALQEVQRGTIKEVGERKAAGGNFPIVVYDDLHNAMRDKHDMVIAAGASLTDVLTKYSQLAKFELGEVHEPGVKLPGIVIRQKNVIDGLNMVLQQVLRLEGGHLKLRARRGKLDCIRPGTNKTRYHFRSGQSLVDLSIKGSIADLVSKVTVLGHGGDDEELPVQKTYEGWTDYAGMQELVYAGDTDSEAQTDLAARQIMAKSGFADWKYTADLYAMPGIYKWDGHYFTCGIADGFYIVSGVSASFSARTMRLSLLSPDDLGREAGQILIELELADLKATYSASADNSTVDNVKSGHGKVIKHAKAGSAWTSTGTHANNDCARAGKVTPAVDIFANLNEPILAPVEGTMQSMSAPLGGNCGILQGKNGLAYYFAHCAQPMVSGAVKQGATIGNVGQTGNAASTQPHVHFAIAHDAATFSSCNGSGDIGGDDSYWTVA